MSRSNFTDNSHSCRKCEAGHLAHMYVCIARLVLHLQFDKIDQRLYCYIPRRGVGLTGIGATNHVANDSRTSQVLYVLRNAVDRSGT
jgi:hypothetical protein